MRGISIGSGAWLRASSTRRPANTLATKPLYGSSAAISSSSKSSVSTKDFRSPRGSRRHGCWWMNGTDWHRSCCHVSRASDPRTWSHVSCASGPSTTSQLPPTSR